MPLPCLNNQVLTHSVSQVCVCVCFPVGVQGNERPIRLHPQPHGPLQEDSLASSEAFSGYPDLYHHESPAGGSTGKISACDKASTLEYSSRCLDLLKLFIYLHNRKQYLIISLFWKQCDEECVYIFVGVFRFSSG